MALGLYLEPAKFPIMLSPSMLRLFWACSGAALVAAAFGQAPFGPCECAPISERPIQYVSDQAGNGTGSTTWSCDTIYVLTETVYVNPGDVLTIEPGTIVQGRSSVVTDTLTYTLGNGNPSQRIDYLFSQLPGSLVIARGASLLAEGTESCPIVFTYEGDPMDDSTGFDERGRWGGLIVCGAGEINTWDGDDLAEGVLDFSGAQRHAYGGNTDPTGSSGTLRYLSIRHAGTRLGVNQFGNPNETNALQLCGVGSGTVIDHIECFASANDGLQVMGGLVDLKYVVSAFNGEAPLQTDQGWQGRVQHALFVIDELNGAGTYGADIEGDDYVDFDVSMTFMPFNVPTLYNCTVLGKGEAMAWRLHHGGGMRLHNSLTLNFDHGIQIADADPCDAWELMTFGEILIENNRFWDIGSSNAIEELISYDFGFVWNGTATVQAHFIDNNNLVVDPMLDAAFETESGFVIDPIDLRPTNMAYALEAQYFPTDSWFDPVGYIGAFAPAGGNWATCWTAVEHIGLFAAGFGGTTEAANWGCTYPFACNYNEEATLDDGSCEITSCAGCTWPDAPNFDPAALYDDGTCIPSEPSTCPADVDGDGTIATSDLLIFLSFFGTNCP